MKDYCWCNEDTVYCRKNSSYTDRFTLGYPQLTDTSYYLLIVYYLSSGSKQHCLVVFIANLPVYSIPPCVLSSPWLITVHCTVGHYAYYGQTQQVTQLSLAMLSL